MSKNQVNFQPEALYNPKINAMNNMKSDSAVGRATHVIGPHVW
jgi:hypothetical protein